MPRVTFEEGWFGDIRAGAVGGVLMMLIAAIWFGAGYYAGQIFFYPPVLFIIGAVAVVKGVLDRG